MVIIWLIVMFNNMLGCTICFKFSYEHVCICNECTGGLQQEWDKEHGMYGLECRVEYDRMSVLRSMG
jgi:hypothetical protein